MTGGSAEVGAEQQAETSPNGRYIRYNSVLGKGAYKTVYKAFDTEEALEVAWNKLHVDRLSEHDLEKVSNEVSLLRQVEHKNIIHFYDTWRGVDGNENQAINFITEQMMSGTLKAYLRKAKAIKLKVIRRWCANILDAIAYLHSQSPPIMHRDLKCDNIFINGHVGEVKIGDLGLSGVKEREKADSVIGTPEFMAPELYEESYTEKVDIYAFGMCLLEIVSMEYPYSECNNMAQIFKKVFNGEKPRAFGMLVDGDVKDVIAACLQREARRPSAIELLRHPLFSDWEKDDGLSSNLCLVKGVEDTATVMLEATPTSDSMPIGTEVIDWSDPLQRSVLVTMREGDNENGDEQQQFSVFATKNNGGFYIGLEIPIRDAIKRVEFTFDPFEDNSTHIAQEMVAEFQLGDEQIHVIREEIDKRVRAAKSQRAEASRNATPQPPARVSDKEPKPDANETGSSTPPAALSPPLSPVQTPSRPTSYSMDQVEDPHVSQAVQKSEGVQENGPSELPLSVSGEAEQDSSTLTGTSAPMPIGSTTPIPTSPPPSSQSTLDAQTQVLAAAPVAVQAPVTDSTQATLPESAHPTLQVPVPTPLTALIPADVPIGQATTTGTVDVMPVFHPDSSTPPSNTTTPTVTTHEPPAAHSQTGPTVPLQSDPPVQQNEPPSILQLPPTAAVQSGPTGSAGLSQPGLPDAELQISSFAVAQDTQLTPEETVSVSVAQAAPASPIRFIPTPNGTSEIHSRAASVSLKVVRVPVEANPSIVQSAHHPKSVIDTKSSSNGFPHKSSLATSHGPSITSAHNQTGTVPSQKGPDILESTSSVSHQEDVQRSDTGGRIVLTYEEVSKVNEVRRATGPETQLLPFTVEPVANGDRSGSQQGIVTIDATVQDAQARDVSYSSELDGDVPKCVPRDDGSAQILPSEVRLRYEEHGTADFRSFPHSASDGQLPPHASIAVVELPARPSTPIVPVIGVELSDEHHSRRSPLPQVVSVFGRDDNDAGRPTTGSDSQSHIAVAGSSSFTRVGSGDRPSSGSFPAIVVVGTPSQASGREPMRRTGSEFSGHSLPSFPSSEGFTSIRYVPTSNTANAEGSSVQSTSRMEQSVSFVPIPSQAGDLASGSASTSPIRSPPPKTPTHRTSSWKSLQSDDSGNNIAPRVPAGKVIGDEHDQKYYTMCLKLMDHCARGNYEDVLRKLDEGANPNFADYDHRTPLHLAAAEGHLSVCTLLIEHGANVDRRDRWANTPLADAIDSGHMGVQTLLKSYGALDEKRTHADHFNMELMRAAAHGDLEAVRSKIVAGADVTYADYDRRTPLHLACTEGHPEVTELLLVNGASADAIDRKGRSPVADAVKNGHRNILRLLRQYGASIPRHLLEAQPELENQKGMDLIEHASRGRVDAVKKALELGANPNFADYDRRTALHLACVEGRLDVVRVLLDAGAIANRRDRWGATPADEAKKGGFRTIADELLLWETGRNPQKAPMVTFENASMIVNEPDRSSTALGEPKGARFNHFSSHIPLSTSYGKMPVMQMSADDFAERPSSSGSMGFPRSESASVSSLPLTPLNRFDELPSSSTFENEQRLLQQKHDAEKQELEEQHRRALEGLQRKKSAESKSPRSSVEGVTIGDETDFQGGNSRKSGDYFSEVTPSGSFSFLPNRVEQPSSDGNRREITHAPGSVMGSSSTPIVQVLRPPRYLGRDVGHNDDITKGTVHADIRSLVDNLIDVASTRR